MVVGGNIILPYPAIFQIVDSIRGGTYRDQDKESPFDQGVSGKVSELDHGKIGKGRSTLSDFTVARQRYFGVAPGC